MAKGRTQALMPGGGRSQTQQAEHSWGGRKHSSSVYKLWSQTSLGPNFGLTKEKGFPQLYKWRQYY